MQQLDILIVDDDKMDRTAFCRHMATGGLPLRVFEAATGAEGCALLAKQSFACLFLDNRLPDMDGIEFLQNFYDVDEDMLPLPVVMMTGQDSGNLMEEALRWGVHDFVTKDGATAASLSIALRKAREVFDLKKTRRAMEARIHQSEKMDAVGQLTSGIAHDFNNLLTVILGNTRLMRRRLEGREDDAVIAALGQKIDAVDTAARKGVDLVRHLMVFARQQEVRQEITPVAATLADICALLERTLGGNITLETRLDDADARVSVDRNMLENAIINLSVNARDAMPKGGRLTVAGKIAAQDGREFYAIAVSDTGSGMSEHVRLRIFEPFFTTKAAGEGTGLGLAMVYGFVRQAGGAIEVDSKEGEGTTFRIRLPLHSRAAQNSMEEACPEKSSA